MRNYFTSSSRLPGAMLQSWQRMVTIVALLMLSGVQATAQQILYAMSGSGGATSTLYTISPTTGAVVSTIGATGYSHITAMAIHPTTGVLYGFVNSAPNTFTGFLVTINTSTGVATPVGNTVGFHGSDMTFSPSGVLYIWAEPGLDDLYTLDLTTGNATLMGNCGCGTARTGLAFTPAGTLYMKSVTTIHRMDPATGQILSTVSYPGNLNNILASDNNNVLFSGTRGAGFTLQTINPATGVVTPIGSNSLANIASLAFSACVAPTFTACPGNLTASTTSTSCNTPVTYTATAGGTPTPAVSYSLSGATTGSGSGTGSGATFNQGVTSVVITATNTCGSATCSFTVTVSDNTGPVLTCPPNISVNNDPGNCSALVTYADPTATDNCSLCAPASIPGYTLIGTHNNHKYFRSNGGAIWTNANAAANALGGHLATISDAAENAFVSAGAGSPTALAWIGFTDQAIENSFVWANNEPVTYTNWCTGPPQEPNNQGNEDYTTINWCAGGGWNDLGAGNVLPYIVEFDCPGVVRTAGLASGSAFPVGTSTVSYSVTDAANNTSTCSFTVTVTDNEAPKITCPANTTVSCAASNHSDSLAVGPPITSDNCAIDSVWYLDGITTGNCPGNYIIARVWTVRDIHNNTANCTQVISVVDTAAPAITCPSDKTIACTDDNTPAGTGSATASDDCSGATVTHSDVTTAGNCPGNYVITRTWIATDACGNARRCVQTITVQDLTAPTAICQNVTVTLGPSGTATATAAMVDNGSSDDCSGIATRTLSKTSFDCSNIGPNPVTLTIEDACGNQSSCTAIVNVIGIIPTCNISVTPSNTTYTGGVATNLYLGYGPQSATITANPSGGGGFSYSWSGPTAYLSCTNCQSPVFTPTVGGTYTFTVTITNGFGCTTTCSVTFCVKDIRVAGNGNNGKVYICHVPEGNPGNASTLSVSVNAVPTHIGSHGGDQLGACGQGCGANVTARQIASRAIDEEVKVYPNPNNGSFTIEIPYTEAAQSQITVTDVQGKVIQRRMVTDNDGRKINLNLGDIARGLYLVEVIYGDQTFRTKVDVR